MPKDWKIYKLGDLISLLTDYHANGAYKKLKANVNLLDKPNYAIMIRTTNFEKNDFNNLKFLNKHAYNFLSKSKVIPGDILMNKIANAGSVYHMPNLKSPVSLGMNLFLIRTNDQVDQTFLFYYMRAKEDYIKTFSAGSVTKTITKEAVRNLDITIPESLQEQKAIAEVLSSLDDKIELNLQMNKTLEEMAMALYKHWFVDFGPFQDGEFIDSELGKIPKGWEVKKLGDLIDLNPKLKLTKGSIASFVEMKVLPINAMSVSNIQVKEFKGGSKFQNKDILFARITPCLENGKCAFVDFLKDQEVAFGSTEFLILRADKTTSSYWVYCLARYDDFRRFAISTMVGTSGRQRVQNEPFLKLKLASPKSSVYQNFNKIVEPWFQRIRINTLENQTLTKTRDTLLSKLISGEVRVKEVEKEVGELI